MSTQTSRSEWQTAAFTKLAADATFTALLATTPEGNVGILDFGSVDAAQTFPFVTLGDAMEGPMNAFGRRGYLTRQMVHIWDNALGFKRAQQILARLNFNLDQQILTLASQTMVYSLYQQSHSLNDPGVDNLRHIVVEYHIYTQE
jgi:hypothetical protein